MAEDLARLEEWFGKILRGMEPAERRRALLKLARLLRKSNLARISANKDPDGAAMEAARPRYEHRRLVRAAGARMFRGLRQAKQWRIDAADDGVELKPASNVAGRMAAVHHFGETATVGRLRNGRRIRYKYPERRLLGFSPEDEAAALNVAADWLGG